MQKHKEKTQNLQKRMAAFLFADIKGYSNLDWTELNQFFTNILPKIASVLNSYSQENVLFYKNSWGDAIFAAFWDTRSAAFCALELRDLFKLQDWGSLKIKPLKTRIALHCGNVFFGLDPVLERQGLVGKQVTLAARVEPITLSDHVWATKDFIDQLKQETCLEIAYDSLGEYSLAKDYGRKILYNLRWKSDSKFTPPSKSTRAEFFKAHAKSQLNDWNMNNKWAGFDGVVEMCYAPNLLEPLPEGQQRGWLPEKCFLKECGEFSNAPRLEENYQKWCKDIRNKSPQKLDEDWPKYVLVNHPDSETDEHFVELEVCKTKWSRVQAAYTHSTQRGKGGREFLFMAADPDWSPGKRTKLDLNRSEFPHSLCLHGVVITKDNKVLVLQRPGPDKTDYHPYAWSFSFEEQLADKDFDTSIEGNSEQLVKNWLIRSVRQEVLGDTVKNYFDVDKVRILAIAIEEEFLNPFLVAYIPVNCESSILANILPHAPDRKEWLRYDFYALDPPEALSTAFKNQKHVDGYPLHPTSRYRLYMVLSLLFYPRNVISLLNP